MTDLGLGLREEGIPDEPGAENEGQETAEDDHPEKAQDELRPQRKMKASHVAFASIRSPLL
jgi:hypothetical protein